MVEFMESMNGTLWGIGVAFTCGLLGVLVYHIIKRIGKHLWCAFLVMYLMVKHNEINPTFKETRICWRFQMVCICFFTSYNNDDVRYYHNYTIIFDKKYLPTVVMKK